MKNNGITENICIRCFMTVFGILASYPFPGLINVHSKHFCTMLYHKEALNCQLQKFLQSCAIINGDLHQKRVKISDKSTKIWCSFGRIFAASKSVNLFGATQGNILLSVTKIPKRVKIRCYFATPMVTYFLSDEKSS